MNNTEIKTGAHALSSRLCLFCTFEEGDIPGYLLTEIHIRTLAGDFDIFILISHDNILSVKTDDPVVAAQIKNVRTVNVVFIYNARRYLFRHLVSSALSFGTSLHYAIIALLIIYPVSYTHLDVYKRQP